MKQRGFTLIELLVVIAIIAVLIALLIPAVQKIRESAARTQTEANMKQVILGFHSAQDAYGYLPHAAGYYGELTGQNFKWPPLPPTSYHTVQFVYPSVLVAILPFVEQEPLWQQYFRAYTGGPWPVDTVTGAEYQVPVYLSGGQDPTVAQLTGITNFAVNLRVVSNVCYNINTMGGTNDQGCPDEERLIITLKDVAKPNLHGYISDGNSNTIALVTVYANCLGVTPPKNTIPRGYNNAGTFFGQAPIAQNPSQSAISGITAFQINPGSVSKCDPRVPQAYQNYAISRAMWDGSVGMTSVSVSYVTWSNAVQPNDGVTLGSDWEY
jgi:prepilin-type N-terminal cleavage/methylation domain-containing protein